MKKSILAIAILTIATLSSKSQTKTICMMCNTGNCGSFTVQVRDSRNDPANWKYFDVTNNTNRELDIELFAEDKNGKWWSQGYANNFKGGTKTTFDRYGATGKYVIAYKNANDNSTRFPSTEEIQKKFGEPGMYHSQYNQ